MTIRSVSNAAGVQAPTIYRLFGDQQRLLDAVAAHGFTTYLSGKTNVKPSADPIEDLRSDWDLHVNFGLANPGLYSLMYGRPPTRRLPTRGRRRHRDPRRAHPPDCRDGPPAGRRGARSTPGPRRRWTRHCPGQMLLRVNVTSMARASAPGETAATHILNSPGSPTRCTKRDSCSTSPAAMRPPGRSSEPSKTAANAGTDPSGSADPGCTKKRTLMSPD
ncbi:TetR/AcrR family transcriptional regulator [Streptomyces sp. H10-C2]|uniref:TetR/AcrR family transcriptional regulator n=1 Tax=unclassified Streptomyces TaxID=2593676 RepID=UPI0024BAF9F1|nr:MULTISPECIES: TetR/AcrR family transcriptional regulator [unclassified Streptomyces]MDJ0345709.1 TetR/AcrR family transcriptional regulator [Streptomyces sp. PH10-H1]MDJ0374561.1 TetR/AcrR family transcriptional regulator [Streptomyces sp. H10-C2]